LESEWEYIFILEWTKGRSVYFALIECILVYFRAIEELTFPGNWSQVAAAWIIYTMQSVR